MLTLSTYPNKYELNGNPLIVEVAANTPEVIFNHKIVLQIISGSTIIGEESLPVINSQASFDISDYCKTDQNADLNIFDLFETEIIKHDVSNVFTFTLFETYNDDSVEHNRIYGSSFHVLNGGFSNLFYNNYKALGQSFFDTFITAGKKFLTWSPSKKLTWNQHDTLYFICPEYAGIIYPVFTLIFNDASETTITGANLTSSPLSVYKINPSYLAQLFDSYESEHKYIVNYSIQIYGERVKAGVAEYWGGIAGPLDTYNFSVIPSGWYIPNQIPSGFFGINIVAAIWAIGISNSFAMTFDSTGGVSTMSSVSATVKTYGFSVRLVRDILTGEDLLDDGTIIPDAYTDVDGNKYDGVKIDDKVYTKSNLKVKKYANGTQIPASITQSAVGGYCVYPFLGVRDSEAEIIQEYGLLYNYYALISANGLVTPGDDNWRILEEADASSLIVYLHDVKNLEYNVIFNHLKALNTGTPISVGEPITEAKTYYIDRNEYNYGRQFIFRNSFGAYDIMHMRGKSENTNEIKRSIGYFQTINKTNYSEFTENIKVASGFLVNQYEDIESAKRYIVELFNSKEVYEILGANIVPIIPDTSKVQINRDSDFLFSFIFEYTYADTDNYFSAIDTEQYLNPRIFYSNGNIEDVIPGEVATVNFDVWINENSTTNFTLNWGTGVGISYLNSVELVDGVTSELEAVITIPVEAMGEYTLIITDNHGGTYRIPYNVVGNQMLFNDGEEMLFNDNEEMLYN